MQIELRLNGQPRRFELEAAQSLLDALREQAGLGSVREACGIGTCGTCTVLLDGRAVSACLLLAAQAEGREVVTLEGLAPEGRLHPVQQAFLEHAAFQCAFCTPGFVLTTVALLAEDPNPDDEAIRRCLEGNLCRCGSYVNILEAVRACRPAAAAE